MHVLTALVQTDKQAANFSANPNRSRKQLSQQVKRAAQQKPVQKRKRAQQEITRTVVDTPAASTASWDHIPTLISVESKEWVNFLVKEAWKAAKAPSKASSGLKKKQKLTLEPLPYQLFYAILRHFLEQGRQVTITAHKNGTKTRQLVETDFKTIESFFQFQNFNKQNGYRIFNAFPKPPQTPQRFHKTMHIYQYGIWYSR